MYQQRKKEPLFALKVINIIFAVITIIYGIGFIMDYALGTPNYKAHYIMMVGPAMACYVLVALLGGLNIAYQCCSVDSDVKQGTLFFVIVLVFNTVVTLFSVTERIIHFQ